MGPHHDSAHVPCFSAVRGPWMMRIDRGYWLTDDACHGRMDSRCIMMDESARKHRFENRTFLPSLFAGMNGICLVLTVAWLLLAEMGSSAQSVFWNFFGGLLMTTIASNPLLPASTKSARKWEKAFLSFNLFVIAAVPLLVTGASLYVPFVSSRSIPAGILILFLLLAGMLRALQSTRREPSGTSDEAPAGTNQDKSPFSRLLRLAMPGSVLVFGLFVAFSLLARNKNGLLEVFVPEYGYFWANLFLTSAMLFIHENRHARSRVVNRLILATGLSLFLICLLPLFSTPFLLKNAATETHAAFGTSLENPAMRSGFRTMPFSLPESIFGMGNGACTVSQDVEYLREARADGTETVLRFDAYLPKDIPKPAEGYPVLIRIHGGAWTIGDKGSGNFAQENKYFAGQGYAVFDVQYGLADKKKFIAGVPVSHEVTGPFDIDDMVRQLGTFTRYLADNREQLQADCGRVFISGGSAGGQLACAVGLGLADGSYGEILDNRIGVRGILPYYPAIGLSTTLGIGGSPQWVDPVLLIKKSSPPLSCVSGNARRDCGSVHPPQAARCLSESWKPGLRRYIHAIRQPWKRFFLRLQLSSGLLVLHGTVHGSFFRMTADAQAHPERFPSNGSWLVFPNDKRLPRQPSMAAFRLLMTLMSSGSNFGVRPYVYKPFVSCSTSVSCV